MCRQLSTHFHFGMLVYLGNVKSGPTLQADPHHHFHSGNGSKIVFSSKDLLDMQRVLAAMRKISVQCRYLDKHKELLAPLQPKLLPPLMLDSIYLV